MELPAETPVSCKNGSDMMPQVPKAEPADPHTAFHRSLTISTSGKERQVVWEKLTEFFTENGVTIQKLQSVDVEAAARGEKNKAAELQWALDSFVETTKLVLDGLVALGNVHPVLGGKYYIHMLCSK